MAQKKVSCDGIREGIFYMYPKAGTSNYVDVREGDRVHKTDVTSGDTSLWKIRWTDDCTYTLTLMDMNGNLEKQSRAVMKNHKLVYVIDTLTEDYYTFRGYYDKANGVLLNIDTMWLHEKVTVTNNQLFERLEGTDADSTYNGIRDTSAYALVYVYRPGKLTLSLANYPVYFDDNVAAVMRNNLGYVFKILKEGRMEYKSRLSKDEASLSLDVRFGHIYFIRSSIEWGMYKRLSNYKLVNEEVDAKQGWTEFQKERHL